VQKATNISPFRSGCRMYVLCRIRWSFTSSPPDPECRFSLKCHPREHRTRPKAPIGAPCGVDPALLEMGNGLWCACTAGCTDIGPFLLCVVVVVQWIGNAQHLRSQVQRNKSGGAEGPPGLNSVGVSERKSSFRRCGRTVGGVLASTTTKIVMFIQIAVRKL
jgi:hypothetical protein